MSKDETLNHSDHTETKTMTSLEIKVITQTTNKMPSLEITVNTQTTKTMTSLEITVNTQTMKTVIMHGVKVMFSAQNAMAL